MIFGDQIKNGDDLDGFDHEDDQNDNDDDRWTLHSKSGNICSDCFSAKTDLRKKCVNRKNKISRQQCVNHRNSWKLIKIHKKNH